MTAPFHLSALRRLTQADRVAFQRFGSGPTIHPSFNRIHHAIQARAAQCPHETAVEHLGTRMSYGELDRRSDQLAGTLTGLGVRPGDRVGLFLTRSTPMVVGILAILKAGAAYVPQDIRITPDHQLQHIVRTAGISVVLTTNEHMSALPAGIPTVVPIESAPHVTPARPVDPDDGDIAMVIFTSGTTGQPNGVQVTHANLCNVLLTEPGSLGIRPGSRVSQLLNIAFDMAAWEILGTLANGGTLVIRGHDIHQAASTADVVIATPSILSRLDPDFCRNVRTVAVAGERCPPALAETWCRRAAFYNSCGPTEVTIVNTMHRHEPGGTLTIGRPVPNTTVYVLDSDLNPCPIGEVGEMWAGGTCVTAGYLGNEALTAERYRPDPFLGGEHKMFRTRDLGRWTADGQLEHHGRTDDQVKVRGFRIELDAVTSALEQSAGCVRATTVLHEGKLIGFVSPAAVSPQSALRAVAERLPYYCVPTKVIPVDQLPITDRGKVDCRALLSQLDTAASLEPVA